MSGDRGAAYLDRILAHVPKVLGMLDREELSPTSGCLDRTFWAWKFTDFPGARFQEGLCALSYLYALPAPANPYAGQASLLAWIGRGFGFWSRIQRSSGDFDEAYPYERSLAATAFTSFYLSEAYRFVGDDLPAETRDRFLRSLELAADWLCKNDETHGFLTNHLAAAACALYHAYQLTGVERFETRSHYFLDKILAHQSTEGWYDEYGGADPGYQTHGSFYLARQLELSGDARIEESLLRSFDFLAHFIHPDRSLGGEYTSRNTQTYYPAGFEMMAAKSPRASWIAHEMHAAIGTPSVASLDSVDAYNLFPLLNNFVFAHRAAAGEEKPATPTPPAESELVHFPKGGLLKVRRPRYDLLVGLSKGGVFKLFDREARRLVVSDSGFIGRSKAGRVLSSQWTESNRAIEVGREEVRVDGHFYQVSRPVMDPYRFIAFRVFSLTVGRVKAIAYWLKALLVRTLIYRSRDLPLQFERRFLLHDDRVEVVDRVWGRSEDPIERLAIQSNFTTIHMGSSRYFVANELATADEEVQLDAERLPDGIEKKRVFPLEESGPCAESAASSD